ncbi:IS256 family transposase, partial [Corynebacterium belfantii]|nr:IS256 family transposase [Corynebacterium belfantii]
GGINAQLKRIADAHRGRSGQRQRKMLEWYLHSKTQLPDDPLEIARQCNYGQDQLAKVPDLVPEDHNTADHETGRPAFYDNAIPTEYQHNIGIRKGPMQ